VLSDIEQSYSAKNLGCLALGNWIASAFFGRRLMKIGLCVCILAVVSAVTVLSATAQSKQPQEGKIVSVQKRDVATPAVRTGADRDRTPVQSHYSLYNVSVQLECEVYVGRYESELDDLPSALSANNLVPVRLKRHVMYLEFPGHTVKMQIVHHEVSHEGACEQAALAK
jgi:hypothetical protein